MFAEFFKSDHSSQGSNFNRYLCESARSAKMYNPHVHIFLHICMYLTICSCIKWLLKTSERWKLWLKSNTEQQETINRCCPCMYESICNDHYEVRICFILDWCLSSPDFDVCIIYNLNFSFLHHKMEKNIQGVH